MTAPTFTNLTGSGASANTTFNTASVSPTANRLILVSIHAYISTGSAQPATPTVTGNGMSGGYTLIRAQDVDSSGTDRATLFVFRGMSASPSAGAVTIDFGAVTMTRCQWSIEESDANVDTSGTNGSGAIVQSVGGISGSGATSLSINYAPPITTGNSGYSAWGHQVQEGKTPRTDWTELADVTTVTLAAVETQYRAASDSAGSATWATGSRAGGVILEIAAGGAADATPTPSVVATVVTVPQATPSAASAVAPAAVTSVATLPQAVPAVSDSATPDSIGAMVSLPAAGVVADATVSPATIAATVALPATSRAVGAGPSAISATVTIPSVTVSAEGNATATPSAVVLTSAVPAPTVLAGGSAAPAPDAVAAVAALPAVTASAGSTVTPAVLAAVATLPQAAAQTGSTVAPAVVAASVALPGVGVGVGASPAVVVAVVALPAATVSATGDASPAPAVIVTVVLVPAVTASAGFAGNGGITAPAILPGDVAQRSVTIPGTIR